MVGRAFLDVARELLKGKTEAHWRAAAGRAYYALMLECREALRRWGIPPPSGQGVHAFVRLRFVYSPEPDVKEIGYRLERLIKLRNLADYDLLSTAGWKDSKKAQDAVVQVEDALLLLDTLEADAPRLAQTIADIKAAWP